MINRKVLVSSLALLIAAFLPLQASAEKVADLDKKHQVLHAMVKTEIEACKGFVHAFRVGLENKDVKVSDKAKKSHAAAVAIFDQAKALHKEGKYRPAYAKASETFKAIQPAMHEILAFDKAPKPVVDAIGQQIRATDARFDKLAPIVAAHASPEGKTAFHEARTEYGIALKAWDKGEKKIAFTKVVDALKKVDASIRTIWPNATAK